MKKGNASSLYKLLAKCSVVLSVLMLSSQVVTATDSSLPSSSSQTESSEALNQVTPISTVRTSPQGATYTISGKIISSINGWGGQGFYIQDQSEAGIYIYPKTKTSLGYQTGQTVQLTGKLSNYNGELQLVDITEHKAIDATIDTPIVETSIAALNTNQPSTLIKLNNVTVGDISSDSYSTSTFTVTDESGQSVDVRVDNRTGIRTPNLLTVIDKGDVINLTAILSTSNNQFQLKPFDLSQFEVVQKATTDTSNAKGLTIAEIQGASHTSPYANRAVNVKNVVVTSVTSNTNFYVQDQVSDNNPATSDAINVYIKQGANVKVGDVLTVTGTVEEYFGNGYAERKKTDLTITQIKATAVEKTGTATPPAPVVLGVDRTIPANIIDNDGMTVFDPEEDALDFWESLEGMVVAVDDAKILGPLKNKEIYVVPAANQTPLNNVGGISLRADGNNTQIIPLLLKSGKMTVKSGDYFTGRITGPVTYSYTNYKVYVDDSTLPTFHEGTTQPEQTTILPSEDKLTIASYNIENFSANTKSTSDAKVQRIAQSFVSDLHSPDIIGLIEVQDNNGATNDGTTDASQSAARLINAIKALGGPEYTYVDIAPDNNQDGGQEGGNIRVGFLYNSKRVSLSDKPKGTATQAVAWENGELNLSVGRIDPTNAEWAGVRKSLAAEFVFNGQKVVVLANHLNSKRGDNGLYGRVQPVAFQSEEKRHVLAQMIADFTQAGLTQNPDAKIVMLGDFNDYEFTKTIQIIETGGMANLVSRHDAADRFSYFYQGNNQSLDNMLVSQNLLNDYTFDMVHVNSAFMEEHGRASDHDPLLVQLNLEKQKDTTNPSQPKDNTDTSSSSQTSPTTDQSSNTKQSSSTQAGTADNGNNTNPSSGAAAGKATVKPKSALPATGQETSAILVAAGIVGLSFTIYLSKKRQEQ